MGHDLSRGALARRALATRHAAQTPRTTTSTCAGSAPVARAASSALRASIATSRSATAPQRRQEKCACGSVRGVHTALTVAYVVVSCELLVIAIVRKRHLKVSLTSSLVQVTIGGILVGGVGVAVGHARAHPTAGRERPLRR